MNVQELLRILQCYKPTWIKGRLSCMPVIDEALLGLIKVSSDQLIFEKLCRIEGQKRKRPLSSISESFIGEKIELTFNHVGGSTLIFSSIGELASKYPVLRPSRFVIFISSSNTYAFDETSDVQNEIGEVKHYLQICSIWKQLKKYCDHAGTTSEMTFLYRKKISLKAEYSQSILKQEFDGLERFSKILSDLDDDSHKEGKNHILQNTLVTVLGDIDESKRFEYLLTHFTQFTSKFDDAYHAYVVGFSFDKLRKEHEERYREYMVKINDLVSSSLIKALMIPGALYLTATRTQSIQTAKNISDSVGNVSNIAVTPTLEASVVNLGIAAAAFFICLIYWWILSNESNSIDAVEVEYKSLMDRLKDKSPDASKAIEGFVGVLFKKIKRAKRTFIGLKLINILAFMASLEWLMVNTYGYTLTSKICPYLDIAVNYLKYSLMHLF